MAMSSATRCVNCGHWIEWLGLSGRESSGFWYHSVTGLRRCALTTFAEPPST